MRKVLAAINILTLSLFGCQSPDGSGNSAATDTTGTTVETNRVDSVTSFQSTVFFDTAMSIDQIMQEVDDYSKTVVNNVPPKPCEEYVLRAIVGSPHAHVQPDSLLFKRTLCEDIRKYEEINNEYLKKCSENASTYGCWHYTFQPVGEKYYIIEGVQMIDAISEVKYYYQRKE